MPTTKKAPPIRTPDDKVKKAKQVSTQAINKAAAVAADIARNRSTRTRSSYKIKADALDRVARILSGKE
jgi:ornithine carbamoyltransferase